VIVVAPDAAGLAQAAEAVRRGEVVAYPTETVYGLAVDPWSETALDRLFAVKGRPDDRPILLIVDTEAQLHRVTPHISARARACMQAFWPGPLTVLFPRDPSLPSRLTAGQPMVAVRCPGSEIARALCRACGHAVTSSSANLSGEPAASSLADLPPGIGLAIDGGMLPPSPPSTLYDPESGRVLREGAIPARDLEGLL
jgi:L-threonylcarbamoyladenylate synthase